MSDTLIAYVVSVAILAALALFIPCMELLAGLLRRKAQTRDAASVASSAKPHKQNIA